MTRDLGVWLIRPSGEISRLPDDPGDEYYFEPRPMPEKQPGAPTEIISVNDAYRRFTLEAGPQTAGIFYARQEPIGQDKVRLLETMYGNYGRD